MLQIVITKKSFHLQKKTLKYLSSRPFIRFNGFVINGPANRDKIYKKKKNLFWKKKNFTNHLFVESFLISRVDGPHSERARADGCCTRLRPSRTPHRVGILDIGPGKNKSLPNYQEKAIKSISRGWKYKEVIHNYEKKLSKRDILLLMIWEKSSFSWWSCRNNNFSNQFHDRADSTEV